MDNINQYTLRALEPDDLDLLYDIENDKSLWKYSNTSSPFSKHNLKKFIENSSLYVSFSFAFCIDIQTTSSNSSS